MRSRFYLLLTMVLCGGLGWAVSGRAADEAQPAAKAGDAAAQPAEAAAAGAQTPENVILRGMLEARERQTLAENQAVRGDKFLAAGEYQAAADSYRRALELDPANARARTGSASAARYLEARADVSRSSVNREIERARIGEQHTRVEALNHIARAKLIIDAAGQGAGAGTPAEQASRLAEALRSLDEGEDQLRRARLGFGSLPARFDVSAEKQQVDDLERRLTALRGELADKLKDLNNRIGLAQAEAAKQEASAVQTRQIAELKRRAQLHRDLKEFEQAKEVIEEIRRLDPADVDAAKMLDEIQLQSRDDRRKEIESRAVEERRRVMENVEKEAIPTVSPAERLLYPKNWDVMEKRRQSRQNSGSEQDEASQAIRRKLEERFSVIFEETEVRDALDHLARQAGVNIILGRLDEEPAAITLQVRDMRLQHILRWIMTITGLSYDIRKEVILVSSASALKGQVTTEVYDVRDIAFSVEDSRPMPGDEEEDTEDTEAEGEQIDLGEIIRKVLQDDFAEGAGQVEFNEGAGVLTVVCPPEAHERVRELLGKLRAAQAIQVAIEARFLKIHDDFWEEISSSVSDYNNWVTDETANYQRYLYGNPNYPLAVGPDPADPTAEDSYIFDYTQPGAISSGPNTTVESRSPYWLDRYGAVWRDEEGNSVPVYYEHPQHPWYEGHPNGDLDTAGVEAPLYSYRTGKHYTDVWGNMEHQAANAKVSVYGSNLGAETSQAATPVGLRYMMMEKGWLGNAQLAWFLSALKESKKSDELFAPHLVVYNNRRGWVRFHTDISYISMYQRASAGNDLEPVVDIVRDGASLQVRPTVSADKKYITLDIFPRVAQSDPDKWTEVAMIETSSWSGERSSPSFKLPVIQRKEVRTFATMPDGGTILVSGLTVNVNSHTRNGVPLLQDVPILGNLFSQRTAQKEKQNIVIMVNARMILLDEEEAAQTR